MSAAAPSIVSWNLTRRCNLACAHCYLDAGARGGRAPDELGSAACRAIVDQLCTVNREALLILTGGEPLLRADLEELCAYASAQGLWVVIGTNGTLLTPERARRVKQAGVKGVGISIDSTDSARHDAFRGKAGAWVGAVAGLTAASAAELDVVLQVTVMPWNLAELAELAHFAESHAARGITFYFLVCTGRGQRQVELSPGEAEGVYGLLHELQKQHAGRLQVQAKCAPQYQRFIHQRDRNSPSLHAFPGGCPAGIHYCRIGPSGEVTPCPYIPLAGGNLTKTPFSQIWLESEVFARLRDRTRLQGRCGACPYRQLCGGCRARALADRGDLWAEDPTCGMPAADGADPLPAWPIEATYGDAADGEGAVSWEPGAHESLKRIPPFVRGLVKSRMEQFALRQGTSTITYAMMIDIRERMRSKAGLNSTDNEGTR